MANQEEKQSLDKVEQYIEVLKDNRKYCVKNICIGLALFFVGSLSGFTLVSGLGCGLTLINGYYGFDNQNELDEQKVLYKSLQEKASSDTSQKQNENSKDN